MTQAQTVTDKSTQYVIVRQDENHDVAFAKSIGPRSLTYDLSEARIYNSIDEAEQEQLSTKESIWSVADAEEYLAERA